MKSPILLLSSLLNDFRRLNPDVKGLDRDFETIENRFENEGYGFLTIALPAFDDALLLGLSTGKFTCPPHFKTVRGGAIPRFLSGMLCEVFDPVTGILKETVDFGCLKSAHGLLKLFKKIQLPEKEAERLDLQAKTEFFRNDELIGQVILPDRWVHHIRKVASYVLDGLKPELAREGSYKHGPGAVFEGYSVNQKWFALSESVRKMDFDLEKYGFDTHEVSLTDLSVRIMESSESTTLVASKDRALCSTAKLISVPKNTTSRRTITIEPMLNQFRQQGLMLCLRQRIDACRVLSKSVDVTDQGVNQKLALEGSLYDNWATIDLSSASDLLSLKVVEIIFGRHAEFFQLMMDCRSTSVSNGIETIQDLRKFAGMGNALTFPVQSVCFAVIGIAAVLDNWGMTPSYWNVVRAARHVRAYGDDIVVSSQHAHQCVNWLQNAGLKVNVKKSFLSGFFKESCGVDAFRGVDITPLYLKHRPEEIEASPKLIENFVSLSNQAWNEGLYEFSNALKDRVESLLRRRLPLVSSKSGALGWHCRQDAVTPHKWCRNTHRFLTRTFASVPLKRKDRLGGWPALLKFFHVPLQGRDRDHLSSTEKRHSTRLALRWVPSHANAEVQDLYKPKNVQARDGISHGNSFNLLQILGLITDIRW